ncbi:MAG: hypothetical protein FJW36_00195 [Acidobacteria bacterium]|nr:hypothetical protein [Acidobacteriota bacterium]
MKIFRRSILFSFTVVFFDAYRLDAQSIFKQEWDSKIDQIASEVSAKNYKGAAGLLNPIVLELMKARNGRPMPGPKEVGELLRTDAAIVESMRGLKIELRRSDLAPALLSAYRLGMSLSYMDSMLAPELRLRQERLAMPQGQKGRALVVVSNPTMLAAFRGNEFGEAERLAQTILSTEVKEEAGVPGVARFRHNAYTVLGLVALNRKDVEAAKRHLVASVSGLKADETVAGGQPNLALAEGLLKAGEKSAVQEYVRMCTEFAGWEQSKAKLRRYLSEVEAGTRTTFAPEHLLMF